MCRPLLLRLLHVPGLAYLGLLLGTTAVLSGLAALAAIARWRESRARSKA